MNLAVSDAAYFQVNAIANEAIDLINRDLDGITMKPAYKSQYKRLIKEFKTKPEKFKLKNSPKIPDGSPIGVDNCSFILN